MHIADKRTFLFHQQNGLCHYCGKEMILAGYPGRMSRPERKRMASKDHIIPRAHGGTHNIKNLVCACNHCNTRRGTMPYHLFVWIHKNHRQWQMFARRWAKARNAQEEMRLILRSRQAFVYV